MTREIKFRAWSEPKKKMGKVVRLNFNDKEGVVSGIVEFDDHLSQTNAISVMQFTNLLDKNGKEIYEGDIVEYKKRWSSTVVFEDGMFRHKDNGDKISWGALILIHRECEIIGNIYEHSHLLAHET